GARRREHASREKAGAALEVSLRAGRGQDHPREKWRLVPADMVMASGSGLDPHITLKNALYQLDRVAAKRAADANRSVDDVRKEIEALLEQKKEAPLGGLVGVDLVNVLEVNLALREKYETSK